MLSYLELIILICRTSVSRPVIHKLAYVVIGIILEDPFIHLHTLKQWVDLWQGFHRTYLKHNGQRSKSTELRTVVQGVAYINPVFTSGIRYIFIEKSPGCIAHLRNVLYHQEGCCETASLPEGTLSGFVG